MAKKMMVIDNGSTVREYIKNIISMERNEYSTDIVDYDTLVNLNSGGLYMFICDVNIAVGDSGELLFQNVRADEAYEPHTFSPLLFVHENGPVAAGTGNDPASALTPQPFSIHDWLSSIRQSIYASKMFSM